MWSYVILSHLYQCNPKSNKVTRAQFFMPDAPETNLPSDTWRNMFIDPSLMNKTHKVIAYVARATPLTYKTKCSHNILPVRLTLTVHLFFSPLTSQDPPVWCLSWEELQTARMSASSWSLRQASATSPPDATTTGVAAGCPRNAVVLGVGRLPECRKGKWKTHWGSSPEALCCPEKRKKEKQLKIQI